MRLGRIVAALVAVSWAAGCTVVVGGTVRPAPGLTPHPLTGQTVQRVLLDDGELSKMLDQSFKSDPNSPPRFGGIDKLYDGNTSPRDCAGAAIAMPKTTYRDSDAHEIAYQSRAKFTEGWQHCDGTTLSMGDGYFTWAISDVSNADSVLAATVQVHSATTVPNARAIGVRVNCLVEVDVAFFSDHPDTSATDVARRMMDNLSDLS